MRRVLVAFMCATLGACAPADVQRPEALVGRYAGPLTYRGRQWRVELEIAPVPGAPNDSLHARMNVPELGLRDQALESFSFAPPRVHFVIPDSGGRIAFDGWFRRTTIMGFLAGGSLHAESRRSLAPALALQRQRVIPDSLRVYLRPDTAAVANEPRSLGGVLGGVAGR